VEADILAKDIMRNNSSLNLFNEEEAKETTYVYSCLTQYIKDLVENSSIDQLIDKREELIKISEREFTNVVNERNQFYNFSLEQQHKIEQAYKQLISEIHEEIISGGLDLKSIIVEHRRKLKDIFSKPIDKKHCYNYDAQTQIDILGIQLINLVEPIIDVGCGRNANIVQYLFEKGYSVIGIDRYCELDDTKILQANWNDFHFKENAWGTVISHMAFSNHFIYHYLKNDSIDYQYAIKYKEILDSLKQNGSFYYAPSLPFIEKYLNTQQYNIEYSEFKQIGITHIMKLY
jgi:hypothetical protein